MEQGDKIYILVRTWGCYSDYCESVLYVTDYYQDALTKAKQAQLAQNAECIAKEITQKYSNEVIDEDTRIVLRSYPFKQAVSGLTEAEREAYRIDERILYEANEVSGKINGREIECYLLKPEENANE